MKYLFILFLSVSVIACSEKSKEPIKKTCISLIADTTDRFNVHIEPDPILRLYHLDQSVNSEALFRFKVIKDIKLVPVVTYKLELLKKSEQWKDPQERNRNVLRFYNDVRGTINRFQALSASARGLDNSECFSILAEELNYLREVDFDSKIVIVVSDLFEKSFIDVYQKQFSSEEIYHQFKEMNLITNPLDGIKIIFVFNPGSRQEDARFRSLISAYKKLLEPMGVVITVQASCTFYDI